MFDRAPTFHVGAYICGHRIFCTSAVTSWTQNNLCMAQLLLGLRIFHERRHFSIDADILGRQHFAQGADILHRAPTFKTPTFYIGRQHFDVKYYFVYCRQRPIFYQFMILQSVLPVYFAISFCLIFLLLIFVCISVSIYACCVRQNFCAIVLKPRFKIDIV